MEFLGLATTQVAAAVQQCGNGGSFLGLVPWYEYLPLSADRCSIGDGFEVSGANSGFLLIFLAIAQDLLRIAAFVAVGYVLYGGVKYVISQGSPDSTKQAQQTIINALAGLVIAIIAATIVNLIGTRLGG